MELEEAKSLTADEAWDNRRWLEYEQFLSDHEDFETCLQTKGTRSICGEHKCHLPDGHKGPHYCDSCGARWRKSDF